MFSIIRHTRPDRQTMLFSATLPGKVRHLTREALSDAVNITVGKAGDSNEDVRQTVLLMANGEQKMQWLQARLQGFVDDGDVLVFVNQQAAVEAIAGLIKVCMLVDWCTAVCGRHRIDVDAASDACLFHTLV